MDNEIVLRVIILGPVALAVILLALRVFFRGSVLFKIGAVVGLFAVLMTNLSVMGHELSKYAYLFTVPISGAALVYAFSYLKKSVKNPLEGITAVFNKLKDGNVDGIEYLKRDSNDEFGDISSSANKLIDGFAQMSNFADEIGKGNLDAEYELLSEDDTIGKSLKAMQQSLQKAKVEDEKRKQEDEKHYWTNEGFAKFGEILRQNTDNNTEFYYSIISNLVKYVDANQGGLFLINDEDENDKYIELVAMYAYERRKYVNKRIELGENLVGQCVLEGESIYMTEIPQNYIRVTSGLGDANPSCILLVPLVFNDQVFGVIELASFSEIEPYQKTFVEKLGDSIASTISTYKINLKTVQLLEDSKLQSEELAAQEEEIRQNMEELQTTQEESARREAEMSNMLEAVKSNMLFAELDLRGKVMNLTDSYARLLATSVNAAVGMDWLSFIKESEEDNFAQLIEEVTEGNTVRRMVKTLNNVNILESYSLVNNAEGYPEKIVNMAVELPTEMMR